MSGILKGSEGAAAANVRPLWDLPASAEIEVSEVEAEIAALRAELEAARLSLVARDEELKRLEAAAEVSVRRALEEGRELGLAEAERRSDEMVALLEEGVSGAVDSFASGLADLEGLAVLIARESLAKIIGDPGRHGELLARIIRLQLEKIESHAVVAVEVSKANFESEAEVAPLLARDGITIRISNDLESGDCRIRLRLGTIEAGLGRQWDVIRDALDEMAGAGGA